MHPPSTMRIHLLQKPRSRNGFICGWVDKNRPAKNELVLTKPKSYSVTENRDRIMAGTTRNCGEKTYKYSSISKLWALYKNDDPPSVEDEEEEDEQDKEEEDADDEDDDDAALFAHGTVGDAAAGDNDDELVDDPDEDVPLAQSLSKPKKDTNDKGRDKDKAIKNPEKANGKGPKVHIQLAGTAKSITTKPTRSEQRAQSQGNVEKMAACGEQLIKKTGITPARLKAHYKRCHDGLDPQTAGFKRREIGLSTTLVTGGAQDQLMELFGLRADHCKAFPTARMLLQNMHKTNAAFGDADAYAGSSHAHETYNTFRTCIRVLHPHAILHPRLYRCARNVHDVHPPNASTSRFASTCTCFHSAVPRQDRMNHMPKSQKSLCNTYHRHQYAQQKMSVLFAVLVCLVNADSSVLLLSLQLFIV